MSIDQGASVWETYEEVARYLLDRIAAEFSLGRVEGKQKLAGSSGSSWEIDAKGVLVDDAGTLVVECKHYPKRKVNQSTVASLAYTIQDLGATGGIIVTPVGLQAGAVLIAKAGKIEFVRLNAECTTEEYLLEFLNKVFVGAKECLSATEQAVVHVLEQPTA